ncbi:MAG TPA: hypothetical protein VF122_02695, partial [Caulobacteraceae bacterium]
MTRLIGAALAAATLGLAGAAHAQDATPNWEFSTGVDYATGDYGGDVDSDYYAVPIEAKVTIDRLRFEVSVPWVSIDGPANLVGGGGVVGGGSADTSQRSGLGDVNASAAVAVLRGDNNRSALELGGRVKFPTADDDIGTGETDFAAMVNGRKAVSDTTLLFGSVGYEWMGDPEAYDVEDGFLASAGVNFAPGDRSGFGAALYYREPYTADADDYITLSPYFYT